RSGFFTTRRMLGNLWFRPAAGHQQRIKPPSIRLRGNAAPDQVVMSYQLCKQSVIRQLLPLAREHRRLSQTEVIQPTIEQRDLLKVPSWVSVSRWEAACCIPRRASIRGQTPNSELREFGVWSRICLSAVCLMAAGGERGVRVEYDVAVHVGDAHEGAVVCSRFSGIHECELDGCAGHAVI